MNSGQWGKVIQDGAKCPLSRDMKWRYRPIAALQSLAGQDCYTASAVIHISELNDCSQPEVFYGCLVESPSYREGIAKAN